MADAPRILDTDYLDEAYPKMNLGIENANEALKKVQATSESLNKLTIDESKIVDNAVTQVKTKNPLGKILQENTVIIDFKNNLISLARDLHVFNESKYIKYIGAATTLTIPSDIMGSTDYESYVLYIDINDWSNIQLKLAKFSTVTGRVIILTRIYQKRVLDNSNGIRTIDSNGNEVSKSVLTNGQVTELKLSDNIITYSKLKNPIGRILHKNNVTIDFKNLLISLSRDLHLYNETQSSAYITASVTVVIPSDIMGTSDYNSYVLYVDVNDWNNKKLKLDKITNVTGRAIILTRMYQKRIYDNYEGIRVLDSTGKEVIFGKFSASEDNNVSLPTFSEATHRLLLPPKMFFVEGETLPMYKGSIISSRDNLEVFKTALVNIAATGIPRINYFYEDISLKSSELSDSFKVMIKQNTNRYYSYYQEISKKSVPKESKQGTAIKELLIGDSLTNYKVTTFVKQRLEALGISVTMLGTFKDTLGTNTEGRPGWEYDNFIGRDNTNFTSVISVAPSGSASTTRDQNPFLKLATAEDKANHPSWCFRNTGSNNELSYADDTDKTGDFYIFDFAWYLSNRNVQTPDVITIALGTNDIIQEGEAAIERCRFSLDVIIRQIKAALPNVKIGVIPSPAWNINRSEWDSIVPKWIEFAMADVKSLSTTFSNLDIVPIWCHMNKDFTFPLTAATLPNSPNETKRAGVSDSVHFDDPGRWEYANALSAYVMNVI